MPTTLVPVLLAAALLAPAAAAAQRTTENQPETPTREQIEAAIADMHPGVLLGRRAGVFFASRRVIPTVVLVPDPAAYAEAIAAWTPETVYPVLIDDGSQEAREDVARFVRAFRPEAVVRWKTGPEHPRPGGPMRDRRAVPNARALADSALPRSWGLDPDADTAALLKAWIAQGVVPPGVVIADPLDPAWTAALALAAGRAQPLLWLDFPARGINGSMDRAASDQFSATLEQRIADLSLPWNDLGDAIDAVTLCGSLPGRIQTAPDEFAATTDRLGRTHESKRWAWAGQLFGSEPEAAYRAMCSLFLQPQSAWIFDGYGSGAPWNQWDGTAAGEYIEQGGLLSMVDDEPRNTASDWRLRAERPVHAGLIFINSSGNRTWFDLAGARAQAGDVPILDIPAAVHMVHSWSAAAPQQPNTVAGRWLERGVFAYIGSVHEPYLQAFVPTPTVVQRLLVGMAFGAAGRLDTGPVWRVTVLADPLFCIRPESPTAASEDLPLEGAEPLDAALKEAAADKNYADLYATLALLGRDSDVARLFEAMMRDEPGLLDADVAAAALMSLFRTSLDDEFLRAYAVLDADRSRNLEFVDALWHVGRRAVREDGDYADAAITLMSAHIRESQSDEDAATLQQLGAGRR